MSFTPPSFSLYITQDFDQPHNELVDNGQEQEQEQEQSCQNLCCMRKPKCCATGSYFGD